MRAAQEAVTTADSKHEDDLSQNLTPRQVKAASRLYRKSGHPSGLGTLLAKAVVSHFWLHVWACVFVGGIFALAHLLVQENPSFRSEANLSTLWWVALSALGASIVGCMAVLVTQRFHSRFSMDHDLNAVQKLHETPVPRIGGLPVFLALFISLGLAIPQGTGGVSTQDIHFLLSLLGVCLPVFLAGTIEDITKKVSPTQRLIWAMVSGLLACWLLGAVVTDLGFTWTKTLLAFAPAAYLFSAFAMAGMSNAINMIDGLNGLASGVVSMLALAISLLAAQYGDVLLVNVCLALSFSMLGFWLFNFPFGKIFLGDGGAYLMGFLLGALTILLKARIPTMDAWMILSLLAYPVIEVLYSIGRRIKAKAAPDQPDFAHFHQLVQRWLSDLVISRGLPMPAGRLNSHSTPFIWMFAAASLALAFAGHAVGLDALGFVATAVVYVVCYQILSAYVSRAEARMGRALHRKD
jgi:UDP-N-acetylmuramyl pentapeptide phosphotransferase/UDP-N-acetylglucosamine-1-phosphate transferase